MNLSATKKGLITGAVMIIISVIIFAAKGNFENKLQYITYTTYVAGILWTLIPYSKQADAKHTFGAYFGQGFKCFIVVTLLMVVYTAAFMLSNPGFQEQMATVFRTDLVKTGNYTPKEIDEKVAMARKSFLPAMIMAAVFGYLVIGAMVTVIAAGFLSQKNKMNAKA